jgi:biopolymer transport protein ExbD
MAMVIRNEGAKVTSTINVTPMVDVMLVLLIIFMVITPMITPGQTVQLAKTEHPLLMPDADKDDALVVAINREGQIFFGAEKIDAANLTQKIRDRLAGRNDKPVFVKADARCHYGKVVKVVDDVRAAGVNELGLLTEQRRELR